MPTGASSWAVVWLLALATFVVGTSELVIAGVLPVIAEDLRVDVATAGYLVTAYALAYEVATPIVAATSGGLGKRSLLTGCLVVFAIATALSAMASTFELLIVARV